MGNKWEKQSETIISKVPCPCGKGRFIISKIHYEDDYLRDHYETVSEFTCEYCKSNYEYRGNRSWITKKDTELLKNLENDRDSYGNSIYDKLYDRTMSSLNHKVNTIKDKYNFLYDNGIGHLPGSIGTVYKNGLDYYIGKKFLRLENTIKLFHLLNIEEDEIKKLIDEYYIKCENINIFIKNNTIKR